MGLFRRRRQRLTRQQTLRAIPVRNRNMTIRTDDAGLVTVTIPWRRGWWAAVLGALLMVPRERRRRVVQLDEVGSFVFNLCDGRRTVETIVDIFARRYKLSRKEATVAIVSYLGQLARRGIIALLVPGEVGRGEGESGKRGGESRPEEDAPG